MGCEKPAPFMYMGLHLCVTVWSHNVLLCSLLHFLLLPPTAPPPAPPCSQPSTACICSATVGYCWLGDHYKGHKRAIYRSAGEWSQHGRSSHPAAVRRNGSPTQSGESEALPQGRCWFLDAASGLCSVRIKLLMFSWVAN